MSDKRDTINAWAIADSGATSHFLVTTAPTINKTTATCPLSVKLPDGAIIKSTHTCDLNLPQLPGTARTGHIIPGLANHSLISVVTLCNAGCQVIFEKTACIVKYDGKTILCGTKCKRTGLWMLPLINNAPEYQHATTSSSLAHNMTQLPSQYDLVTPTLQLMNSVHETTNKAELAEYLHQCLFSPTPATLIKAIKNDQLISFPGLTEELITKHLPPSTATVKGHMHSQRKNVRSTTKAPPSGDDIEATEDMTPVQEINATEEVFCFSALADMNTGTIYTDQTGKFPVQSYKGMRYIFCCYVYSLNVILVRPMKNRSDDTMISTFKNVYQYLEDRNFKPKLHVMDNECSKALQRYITHDKNTQIQFVPPNKHRVNAAERAIRTFKEHFIAGLATVDKMFPLQLWDELLEQAQDTLNMLRTARVNPRLSAYAILEGQFNFNKTPLAPPGTKALIYNEPNRRTTFGPHATDGWYTGPAKLHYRCYRFYVPSTKNFRIAQSAKLFPTHCKMPTISPKDAIQNTAQDLVDCLKNPHPQAPVNLHPTHLRALQDLSNILSTAATPKRVPAPVNPQRVDPIPPQRVRTASPTTSHDITNKENVRQQNLIHQKVTRRNKPMPPIFEVEEPSETQTDPAVAPTPNTSVPITQDTDPPKRRSERLNPIHYRTPKYPAFISQEALYLVLGKALRCEIPSYTPSKLANEQLTFSPEIELEEVCNGVVHPITKETITKYNKLIAEPLLRDTWTKAMCIELGRLAQGYGTTKGTNTIRYLTHAEIKMIPKDRTVTYARIVVDYRPQKEDPNRVRITVGGNLIDYPGELITRTADLTTTKIMLNSVLSTPNAKYVTADVKNFYLETPLDRFEYMRMPIKLIPEEIIKQYGLREKVMNGMVYMQIEKGMYGLPQSGILASKLLKERLAPHGYYEMPHTPGLWKHVTRPISFTLVVDDFGIKTVGDEHKEHLLAALREEYTVEVDETGGLYCGIKLNWHYNNGIVDDRRYLDMAMPTYVAKQREKYDHPRPSRPQDCPYAPAPIKYGVESQTPAPIDDSPRVGPKEEKFVRQVVGSFLYYGRAVDPTILMSLSELASQQSAPTENTMKRVNQFLDYMATHPDAIIRYYPSDMILQAHSDASYLSAPKARSRAGAYFFLGSLPKDGHPIRLNGAIDIMCEVLKSVAASAAEAELGALFLTARRLKVMRLTLHELGHPQPPTPIHIDNTTAVGIVNNTIKRQRSRAMEMRYFWLLDQEAQRLFKFYHQPGQENLGDYVSKHHNAPGHRHVRPYYVHTKNSPRLLERAEMPSTRRGCVGKIGDLYLRKNPLPVLRALRDYTQVLREPAAPAA